mgnify:CR=1 FL=1
MTRALAHVQSRNLSRVLNAQKDFIFQIRFMIMQEVFLYGIINTSDVVWTYPSNLLDFYT